MLTWGRKISGGISGRKMAVTHPSTDLDRCCLTWCFTSDMAFYFRRLCSDLVLWYCWNVLHNLCAQHFDQCTCHWNPCLDLWHFKTNNYFGQIAGGWHDKWHWIPGLGTAGFDNMVRFYTANLEGHTIFQTLETLANLFFKLWQNFSQLWQNSANFFKLWQT